MLRQITEAFLASTLQKTAEFPQLQFLDGRGHSLRYSEADPHGPDCLADHSDFAAAVRVGSSMSLLCLSCSLLVVSQTCRKLWFPQLQLLSRRLHARCCAPISSASF